MNIVKKDYHRLKTIDFYVFSEHKMGLFIFDPLLVY